MIVGLDDVQARTGGMKIGPEILTPMVSLPWRPSLKGLYLSGFMSPFAARKEPGGATENHLEPPNLPDVLDEEKGVYYSRFQGVY